MEKILTDFFGSEKLELPRSWVNDSKFEDFLNKIFKEHEKLIGNLCEFQIDSYTPKDGYEKNYKYIIKKIKKGKDVSKNISEKILSCLKECFNNRESIAYKILKNMLGNYGDDDNGVLNYLKELFSVKVIKYSKYAPFSDLYRVTINNGDLSQNPLRLFHVPYNLCKKIGTNRYSIPGFPCLYIGGSSELCWRELNMPQNEKLYIVKYDIIPDKLRFLNLAYNPKAWKGLLSDCKNIDIARHKDLIAAHAVCWPLIAACSIIRKDPKSKFAPEYVIPQMLLKWVIEYEDNEGKIDGIRYFSTKYSENSIIPKSTVNYVFPAIKSNDDKMYSSKLAEKFRITNPILIDKKGNSYDFSKAESILKNSPIETLLNIINKNDLESKINEMSIMIKKLEKMVRSLKNRNK